MKKKERKKENNKTKQHCFFVLPFVFLIVAVFLPNEDKDSFCAVCSHEAFCFSSLFLFFQLLQKTGQECAFVEKKRVQKKKK